MRMGASPLPSNLVCAHPPHSDPSSTTPLTTFTLTRKSPRASPSRDPPSPTHFATHTHRANPNCRPCPCPPPSSFAAHPTHALSLFPPVPARLFDRLHHSSPTGVAVTIPYQRHKIIGIGLISGRKISTRLRTWVDGLPGRTFACALHFFPRTCDIDPRRL